MLLDLLSVFIVEYFLSHHLHLVYTVLVAQIHFSCFIVDFNKTKTMYW
jgi:hypothetical protein